MIVNEADCSRRPPAKKSRGFALLISESPVLRILDSLIQDALGSKIKQCYSPGFIKPVAKDLPGIILIVFQAVVPPPEAHSMLKSTLARVWGATAFARQQGDISLSLLDYQDLRIAEEWAPPGSSITLI